MVDDVPDDVAGGDGAGPADRAADGGDGEPADRATGVSEGATDTDADLTRRSLLAAAGAGVAASTAGCADVTTPADAVAAADVPATVGYVRGPDQVPDGAVFLDARTPELFRAERVYGARLAPFDALTARRATGAGRVPDHETMAAALGSVGVAPDDDVVVYGGSVGSRVARVAFALEYLGHEGAVYALNGGFDAWPGRVGVGDRDPPTADYDPDPRADLVVTRDWLADRVGSFNADGPGLVDVRPPEAYLAATGAEALVGANERHGHLPGAVDVHWVGTVDGRQLKPPGDLAALYFDAAGLAQDETTVVYGQDNVDPAHTWLVLRALGAEDVRLYDAGFGEWANVPAGERGRYPVETRTTAVVETSGSVGGGDDGGFSCTG